MVKNIAVFIVLCIVLISALLISPGLAETVIPLCKAGEAFDSTMYAQNTAQSSPMEFQSRWDGKGQVYISGDESSVNGVYADDGYTITIQPSGKTFEVGYTASQHPPTDLSSGMTPRRVNTFTLVVKNWAGYSMSYGSITGIGVDQTPYIVQVIGQTAPVADFSADPTSGTAPLLVQFRDTSTGLPVSWSWNFGDGEVSNVQNPLHQYNVAGTYAVSLTVTNTQGSDTVTKRRYISVTQPMQKTFYVYAEGSGFYPQGYDVLTTGNKTPREFYDYLNGKSGAASVDPSISWEGRGLYLDDDSGSNHWNISEQASSFADNADFSVFVGHGANNRIIFGTQYTDVDLTREYMMFGGNRLKWVTLFACNVLDQNTQTNWESVFNGVHIINGFDTIGSLKEGQGMVYAKMLTGDGGYDRMSIRDAWRSMLKWTIQDSSIKGASMWVEPCGNDYLPGFGDYSDPRKNGQGNYNFRYESFNCIFP